MKKLINYFVSITIAIICSTLVGAALLTAVYAIPVNSFEKNVKSSAYTFEHDKTNDKLFFWCSSTLDIYTDSYMFSEASYNGDETALKKAMASYYSIIGDENVLDSFIDHNLHNTDYDNKIGYSRYWHGYLLFLKPLLLLFDYTGIRVINTIAQCILMLWLLLLLYKSGLKYLIFPYILSISFLMPVTCFLCMQFSSCYYVFTITSIVMLLCKNVVYNEKIAVLIFAFSGIATSFFDFLTFPITTFSIPAIIYLCLIINQPCKQLVKKICVMLGSWLFGYAGVWFGKWLVASIILQKNVISEGIGSISIRTSQITPGTDSALNKIPLLGVFVRNFRALFFTPATIVFFAFVIVLIILIIRKNHINRTLISEYRYLFIPFACIGVLPIIWYVFTINHSSVHYMITFRTAIVLIFAICSYVSVLLYSDTNQKLNKSVFRE